MEMLTVCVIGMMVYRLACGIGLCATRAPSVRLTNESVSPSTTNFFEESWCGRDLKLDIRKCLLCS